MTPTPHPGRPESDSDVEAAAAAWLAQRDAGLSAADAAQFEAWLTADRRHAAAFRSLDATFRVFDSARRRGDSNRMLQELATRARRRTRRRIVTAGSSLVLAAAAAWVVLVHTAPGVSEPHRGGLIAGNIVLLQPERQVLSDGSIIELNRGAKIAVHYTAERRDIELLAGEAFFTVAKNPERPFVVKTPSSSFRAVGTIFGISLKPQGVDLLVTEGKVAANPPARTSGASTMMDAILVTAGYHLALAASAATAEAPKPQPMAPAEVDRRLAWRSSRLQLSSTPLSDVATAFNKQNRIQLVLANPNVGALRLTGVFRVDRVEEFVQLLQAHYGVRVTRRGENELVLDRAS